jgi:hypothetical protein
MRCALCGDITDTESPFMTGGVYERNPETFRHAWMDGYCLQEAIEQTKTQPAKDAANFSSRYDEYIYAIQQG